MAAELLALRSENARLREVLLAVDMKGIDFVFVGTNKIATSNEWVRARRDALNQSAEPESKKC
jgi:hypothetical protein